MASTIILHIPFWDGEQWLCHDWCAAVLATDADAELHYGSRTYVDEQGRKIGDQEA